MIKAAKIGYGICQNEVPSIVKNLLDKKEQHYIVEHQLNDLEKKNIIANRKFVNYLPSKFWN